MRKILLAAIAMFTPALAISANEDSNRDNGDPMSGSDVRDTMIPRTPTGFGAVEPLNHMRTASGTQEVIGVAGTVHRMHDDPHTTIGRLSAAAVRAVAYARNAATAFTSLRRQSTPALAFAAA